MEDGSTVPLDPGVKKAFEQAQDALFKIQEYFNGRANQLRTGKIYAIRCDLGMLQQWETEHPSQTKAEAKAEQLAKEARA
jgi:hypothetical protein